MKKTYIILLVCLTLFSNNAYAAISQSYEQISSCSKNIISENIQAKENPPLLSTFSIGIKNEEGYTLDISDAGLISILVTTSLDDFPTINSFDDKYSDAEKNYGDIFISCITNDPLYPEQWTLNNTGQLNGYEDVDIDADEAWEITTGNSDITIAIIDSGIDFDHPDLTENIWINPDEIPGNGLDDDDNGYIDDVNGYDFLQNDGDYSPVDQNGHGTLLAGRVSPVTNNRIGIAGITWNCKIMPLQVIDESTLYPSTENLIEAIRYATNNDAEIICMTFEQTRYNQDVQNIINEAAKNGVFICAAAGNSGSEMKRYPAAYENVTAVAAINQWNSRMEYTYEDQGIQIASNHGSWVDVAAPGQEIYSTMPTYHVLLNDIYGLSEDYTRATGCCVTTPPVAGVAALLLSKDDTLTPQEISFILRATTESINSSYYLGTGRINAFNALTYDNKPETPIGPVNGKIDTEYTFSSSIAYPADESLYYLWDFGDETEQDWLGPIPSTKSCEKSHIWHQKGNYNVKVKVKDESGGESDWSDPFPVSMQKQKNVLFNQFKTFFEKSHILQILNFIIESNKGD